MTGINNKYDIDIEVLTPLSIGAGAEKDWVKGADFVVKDKILYKLNLKKMIQNGIDINRLSDVLCKRNNDAVLRLIGNKLDAVTDKEIKYPIESYNDIKIFVKNQMTGRPILLGSSLKGAIRSVLFKYLRGNKCDEKAIFGSSTTGDEFMRFIKISDADFNNTELVNTKIFNLRQNEDKWKGGWKFSGKQTNEYFQATGFNTLYECIMPSQKGDASIMLTKTTFDNYFSSKDFCVNEINKKREVINGIEDLFDIINKHTKNYLQKERAFFSKYATDKTDLIEESINNLIKQIPDDNTCCILKMSAGSGFHSITGDWQFDDYCNGPLGRKEYKRDGKPKSRKIAINGKSFSLMGFIKLRVLSDEEKQERQKRIEIEKQNKLERRKKEQQKKEEAEKKERERIEKERKYNAFIKEGESKQKNKEYEDALSKFKEAQELYPNGWLHQKPIDDLTSIVSEIIRKREKEKREKQEELERQQKLQVRAEGGLSALLDEKYEFGPNIGKFKTNAFKVCENKVNSWLKSANTASVPDTQIDVLKNTISRLYSNPCKKEEKNWKDFNGKIWKTVTEWIGEKTARKWFDEIVS